MEQLGLIKKCLQQYKQLVLHNPDLFSRVESSLRIVSYIMPDKSASSSILSELIYSASTVLAFYHDCILRRAAGIPLSFNKSVVANKLLTWLTVLENIDVFLEVAAMTLYGSVGHWVIIVALQLSKALMRLILLLVHKSGVQYYPPVPSNRKRLVSLATRAVSGASSSDSRSTFTLSTGRVVRKLNSDGPVGADGGREWQNPEEVARQEEAQRMAGEHRPTALNDRQTLAEAVHIVRPLAHLAGIGMFGLKSWTPWVSSLAMDTSSLLLMGGSTGMNASEVSELRRRAYMLILYLLRTPFYDRWSRGYLLIALHMSMYKVPVSKYLLKPIANYVPYWRDIYSYCWSG